MSTPLRVVGCRSFKVIRSGLSLSIEDASRERADISVGNRQRRLWVKTGKAQWEDMFSALPSESGHYSMQSTCPFDATSSNLAAVGANARGRNATFLSLRPVLADQCRSPQDCLPTTRAQLRGCSSAQRFRAHSRRYESCGYRNALQVPARDVRSFACSSFS